MADSKKDEVTAQFKKMQRAEDGKRAMAEYESESVAIRAKTARLKELRLAREAADRASPQPAATATKKKKSAKKETRSPGTLSDWLKDQKGSGRRS